ncbi:hypothetical protein Tco_0765359 [Tanacetum coccineum]
MTSRYSEAFRRWRSAPLSTPYPWTTSESSLDSSSERSLDSSSPSAGPSLKRCRSPTTLHMEIGTVDAEAVLDLGIGDGVGAHTEDDIGMGVKVVVSNIREDEEEFEAKASAGGTMEIVVKPLVTGSISEYTGGDAPNLKGTLYDISHYMSEVPLDRITEFETAQRQLEAGQLMASGERELVWLIRRDRDDTCRRLRRTMTNTRSGTTSAAIEELINRRVAEALEARETNRNLRIGNSNDEGGNSNGDGNRNGGGMEMEITMRMIEGTEGVIGLIRWFEKMETIFHISNCLEKYQVKYATCTLLNSALTWWNSHKRTIGTDAAFAMSWRELMKLMAKVYCPRNEIQKMKSEL